MDRRPRLAALLIALLASFSLAASCPRKPDGRALPPIDRTDYDASRPAIAAAVTRDPTAYWVRQALPALARLAQQREDLGLDPVIAFDGLRAGFDETGFLSAAKSGELPPEAAQAVREALAAGATPFTGWVSAVRALVRRGDAEAPAGGGLPEPVIAGLGALFSTAIDPGRLEDLVPAPKKTFKTPPPTDRPDPVCLPDSTSFSVLTTSTPTGKDDDDTASTRKWIEIFFVHWDTTHNASCVAQAVGPCGSKLAIRSDGIRGDTMTCKDWNDLSRALGAKPGSEGADMSDVATWFRGKGYCASRAWDGPFESACQEARKALDRGCDLLHHYASQDGTMAHVEMVTGLTVSAQDSTACTVNTLSWGQAATVTYTAGTYSGKSDGERYRPDGMDKSYLEGSGKATLYYYCKC